MVAVALSWAPLAGSIARGQDGMQRRISPGTFVCFDRTAVDDILAIVSDPDVEEPTRQLTLILSSGECSDRLVGETYEPVEVDKSGIVKAKVHGFSKAYLVPLITTRKDASTH
jgi:hypothetical protein